MLLTQEKAYINLSWQSVAGINPAKERGVQKDDILFDQSRHLAFNAYAAQCSTKGAYCCVDKLLI